MPAVCFLKLIGPALLLWPFISPPATQPTRYAERPRPITALQDDRITEASGISASHRHPGLFYVHNDSGDEPRVFLIDRDGVTRGVIYLQGARAIDYEDIALAPSGGPGRYDVCVADIGDNRARRREVQLYRFAEPDLPTRPDGRVQVTPQRFRLRYADGPADVEAFAVHPQTGDGYFFTKRTDGHTHVYELPAPWREDRITTLSNVARIELPPTRPRARIITAADMRADGRMLMLRCYVDAWLWTLPTSATPLAGHLVKQQPTRLRLAAEPQGEAACFSAAGHAILTVSEGMGATVYESPALEPPPPNSKSPQQ